MTPVTPKSKPTKAKARQQATARSTRKDSRKKAQEEEPQEQDGGPQEENTDMGKDTRKQKPGNRLLDSDSEDEVEVVEQEPTPAKKKATEENQKEEDSSEEEDSSDEEEYEEESVEEEIDLSDVEEDPERGIGFVSNHWSGVFPEPQGMIANYFADATNTEQLQQIENLLSITDDKVPKLELGEFWKVLTPFLVAVPGGGRNVRVVYNLTKADNYPLLKGSDIDGMLLSFTGEMIPNHQYPKAMVFPPSAVKARQIRVPEGETFSKKRRDNSLITKKTWFSARQVDRVINIPAIIPVPAYLVYDLFNKDGCAMIIYERWMSTRGSFGGKFDLVNIALRAFLKAQVVTPTTRETQTRLNQDIFIKSPPLITQDWKAYELNILLPQLKEAQRQPPTPSAASMAEPKPSAGNEEEQALPTQPVQANNHQQIYSDASGNQTTPHLATTPTTRTYTVEDIERAAAKGAVEAYKEFVEKQTTTQTKSKAKEPSDKVAETFGMCRSEFEKLLCMCGLAPGEEDELPTIWQQLAEDNLSKAGKKSIIKAQLRNVVHFEEEKITPFATLIKMIANRDFEEDTSVSSLRSAAKGLTPYAVPPLTDLEIDTINDKAEALELATTTTVKDHTSSTLEAKSPTTFSKLVQLLKRFCNILVALFGRGCPLYVEILALVKHLEGYGDYAKGNMNQQTMSSIVWLVHLQAREFSAGLMTGNGEGVLAAFSVMCGCVQTKSPVVYGDVPAALLNKSTTDTPAAITGATKRSNNNTDSTQDSKRPKIVQIDGYNKLLEEKMKVFRNGSRLPRIKSICEAAKIKQSELFKGKNNFCHKSALFGTCFAGCKRDHTPVTDEEAKTVIKQLEKAFANPDAVKVNN